MSVNTNSTPSKPRCWWCGDDHRLIAARLSSTSRVPGTTPARACLLSNQVRHEFLLEKGWRFTREDQREAFADPAYDDAAWQSVTVPHDWAIYGPFSAQNDKQQVAIAQDGQKEALEHVGRTGGLPFVGVGWYRIRFEAPAFGPGKRAITRSRSKTAYRSPNASDGLPTANARMRS